MRRWSIFDRISLSLDHLVILRRLASTAEQLKTLVSWLDENPVIGLEFTHEVEEFERGLDRANLCLQLRQSLDVAHAFIRIHPGAHPTPDGFEWVQILGKLYQRWAESLGYPCEFIEGFPYEQNGYRFLVLRLTGAFAFGLLKGEIGVHRLVRSSPTDGKRTTTFVMVDVLPDFEGDQDPALVESDLEFRVFRTGWQQGGQHL